MVGNDVGTMRVNSIREQSYQVLLGTLLGDAYIPKLFNTAKSYGLGIDHSTAQEKYLRWKCEQINLPYKIYKRNRFDKRTQKTYSSVAAHFNRSTMFFLLRTLLYPNGKKRLTADILNQLSPQAIAIWYCDDGCLYKNKKHGLTQLSFALDGFSQDERELVKEMFRARYRLRFRSHAKQIRLTDLKSVRYFIRVVKFYVPKCMEYKVRLK